MFPPHAYTPHTNTKIYVSLFRNLNLELTGNHPPWTKSGLYVFGFLAFINLYLIEFWSIIQQSLKLYRIFFLKREKFV